MNHTQRVDQEPVGRQFGLPAEEVVTADHPRVIEQLHEYQLALVRGERPARGVLLDEFPSIAGELAACLDALEFMHHVAPQLGEVVLDELGASSPELPSLLPLGDFRIVRELGRGGMGVVYEAEQLSLARRVALKVLPFAGVLDPRQLQRFKNEAQAAASLHHTHIVPVYSVGCERGVHYYAMQFIEGQTLAEVIRQGKGSAVEDLGLGSWALGASGCNSEIEDPKPKTKDLRPKSTIVAFSTAAGGNKRDFFHWVARLGVEVAEALEYAHGQGVVHRDIKPLNILIDQQGEPWITDFGLARIESNSQLTLSGDVLGTLRYMSPEQVSLKGSAVDHRTDIYSLGATLYELLTQEPAFACGTRQELLRQIACEEPRALRRIEPAVPVELETITLKAMAKDLASRYSSGRELADDLQRFLLDKPILARRPTLVERAAKWSRRHRGVVGVCAGAMLLILTLVIAGLMASYEAISREQQRTALALAEAKAGQAAAAAGRAQADVNLGQALAAVDRMLTRVSEERLSGVPQAEQVRRALLEDALQFYEAFLRERGGDARLRREVAWSHLRVAVIYRDLGQQEAAERAFRRGLADFEDLLKEFPNQTEYTSAIARGCTDLGLLLRGIGGRELEAEAAYRRAIVTAQRLVSNAPAIQGYQAQLAESLHGLGYVLWELRRFPEAEQAFHDALAIEQQLASQSPEEAQCARAQAEMYNSLGLALRQAGQPYEAERAHRLALDQLSALARLDPDFDQTNELARSFGHLGLALDKLGQHPEALAAVRRAWELRKQQYAAWPTSQHVRAELALTTYSLARLLAVQGATAEAERRYREAVGLCETLVHDAPEVAKNRGNLALMLSRLGELLADAGRDQEAEGTLRRALELRTALAAQFPELVEYQKNLAASRLQLALNAARLGKPEEALREYGTVRQMLDAHPIDDDEINRLLAKAAEALGALPEDGLPRPSR